MVLMRYKSRSIDFSKMAPVWTREQLAAYTGGRPASSSMTATYQLKRIQDEEAAARELARLAAKLARLVSIQVVEYVDLMN